MTGYTRCRCPRENLLNLADRRSRGLGSSVVSASRSARLATPRIFDRFRIVPEVQFDLAASGADGLDADGANGAAGAGDRAAGAEEAAAGDGGADAGFDAPKETAAGEFEGAIVTVTVGVTVIVITFDGVPEAAAAFETAVGAAGAAFGTVAGETGTVVIKVVTGMTVISWLAGP